MTGKIRSATIGINFDENLVPISMGLVGFSDKMYEDSGTVIDRILSFGSKTTIIKLCVTCTSVLTIRNRQSVRR